MTNKLEVRYAGIDLHKKYSVITLMDKEGYHQPPIKIDNQNVKEFVNALSQPNTLTKVAVESTFGWYWLADLIDPLNNVDLTLTHTLGLSAFKTTGKKTDKIDSKFLADMLRVGLLPQAHMTSKSNRNLKDVLRHRSFLIQKRGDVKRRTHASLAKVNIRCPYSDIFGKKSRTWLRDNVTKYPYDLELDSSLRLFDSLNDEIAILDKELDKFANKHPDIDLITSVPGIGKIIGLTILCEIDNITRFPDAQRLCSYAGLVPSVSSSGVKLSMDELRKVTNILELCLLNQFLMLLEKILSLNKNMKNINTRKVLIKLEL